MARCSLRGTASPRSAGRDDGGGESRRTGSNSHASVRRESRAPFLRGGCPGAGRLWKPRFGPHDWGVASAAQTGRAGTHQTRASTATVAPRYDSSDTGRRWPLIDARRDWIPMAPQSERSDAAERARTEGRLAATRECEGVAKKWGLEHRRLLSVLFSPFLLLSPRSLPSFISFEGSFTQPRTRAHDRSYDRADPISVRSGDCR